jgi:DNA repair exonuclease SbcCD ATPase subunit
MDYHNAKIEEMKNEHYLLYADVMTYDAVKAKHKKMISLQAKIEGNRDKIVRDMDFYEKNDNCPTCNQSIDETFKHDCLDSSNKRLEEINQGIDKLSEELTVVVQTLSDFEGKIKTMQQLDSEIKVYETIVKSSAQSAQELIKNIHKLEKADQLIQDNEKEKTDTAGELAELYKEQYDLLHDKQVIEISMNLLKDGGIKTKIIKQYVPIINKYVNKYLSQMGFFVNFTIDENFNEVIKSRYRDEFSYANFSEGEKTRIDLALMFTWRAIAKMKNSVNTNLLILDEILDGSLDANGTDEFLKIIKSLTDGTNTFIISHKQDQMLDKFDKVYRFVKYQNFSRLA